MSYRSASGRDWLKVGGYVLLTVVVIVVAARILIPLAPPIGAIVWLTVFVGGGLYSLARWHAKSTVYRCPACGHHFTISVLADFVSPHVVDKKYLKCPCCGRRNWATVLRGG
jgi:DNA-directed RNA polymerase subunit RPC12/RpoP